MNGPLTVGSLFAGIGGFDLGFERAGMRTVWFCEQDEFCQRVLAKHWPGVPCHSDVRALVADTERGDGESGSCEGRGVFPSPHAGRVDGHAGRTGADGSGGELLPVPVPYVDVLAGGFPCQDISVAGRGEGIDGARSGLWAEYARLIRDLRPRYVVVENVSALLARGMERVLGDLAACGYDAEWDCIPASAVGAPHRRDRVWLIAYPNGSGRGSRIVDVHAGQPDAEGRSDVAYPQQSGLEGHGGLAGQPEVPEPRDGGALAEACIYCGTPTDDGADEHEECVERSMCEAIHDVGDAEGAGSDERPGLCAAGPGWVGRGRPDDSGWWLAEPDVGRVAHGVPQRVDRLRSLGNALVPQIAEWIGSRIVDYEEGRLAA